MSAPSGDQTDAGGVEVDAVPLPPVHHLGVAGDQRNDPAVAFPPAKSWVTAGPFHHPAMFILGPGIEHNTQKIGECVDTRELAPVIPFLVRFPGLYRRLQRGG